MHAHHISTLIAYVGEIVVIVVAGFYRCAVDIIGWYNDVCVVAWIFVHILCVGIVYSVVVMLVLCCCGVAGVIVVTVSVCDVVDDIVTVVPLHIMILLDTYIFVIVVVHAVVLLCCWWCCDCLTY